MKNTADEIVFIEEICSSAFDVVTQSMTSYSNNVLKLSDEEQVIIDSGFYLFKRKFFDSLKQSLNLAKKASEDNRYCRERIVYFNPLMQRFKDSILTHFPPAAKIWILDGIIIEKQTGGLKKLAGFPDESGLVIDVLNSASSLSLGAENPWLIKADLTEDYLGIRDNHAAIYHAGIRHGFVLDALAKLYPGKQKSEDVAVHIESSGTIANCIAIESVAAYMEKQGMVNGKILAVDGSWAGGYGSAREATGFGINQQAHNRSAQNIWVDRCLPAPTKENAEVFLNMLNSKLKKEEVSGLFIEPDLIADFGVLRVDEDVIKKVVQVFTEKKLPIILDCVQQIGRTGGYFGEFAELLFKDFPLLVVTAAKSAGGGQPLSYTLMPKVIADAAYPLTQLTTNQMNGSLVRVLVVAEILKNRQFQDWIKEKSKDIESIAAKHGLSLGEKGLRGKFLNRGIYMEDNEQVKLTQIALLVEDGILTGAFPQAIRYQPMLLEFSETNALIAEIIFRRLKKIAKGEISEGVMEIYERMKDLSSGLARKS